MGLRPIQVDEKCWTLQPCSQRFVATPFTVAARYDEACFSTEWRGDVAIEG
jgi:hypothetical protein